MTDREHLALVNQVYAEYVTEPHPNRAAIIVSGFARPEMLVEIVAYAATRQLRQMPEPEQGRADSA